MIERAKKLDKDRFLKKFRKSKNGCWNWIAGTNYSGYGTFYCTINGKRTNHAAHRYSYFLYNAKLPKDMFVCHKCDNPLCVNPDHLFLGTHQDNMQDMFEKGRCRNQWLKEFKDKEGETMSAADVIKKLMKKTGLSTRALSRVLNFPENAVSYYATGKRKPNILNCYRIIAFAKKNDMIVSLEELYPNER